MVKIIKIKQQTIFLKPPPSDKKKVSIDPLTLILTQVVNKITEGITLILHVGLVILIIA